MKYLISFLLKTVPRKYLQHFSHFGLKVAAIFYLGNGVKCPVCEKSYRKFLPYGRRNSRPNALCPNCLSLERHRLLWLYFKGRTDLFTRDQVIFHIAPELCFLDRFKRMENLDYLTGDLESPLAQIKMDIHNIPLEDNRFDVVLCNHVMEHVKDDIKAMSEIYRVLKPGGWAIIQVPFFSPVPESTFEDPGITRPSEREKAYGQNDHVRKYGQDYPSRLAKVGFEVEESDFVKTLDPLLVRQCALPATEIIYVCRKQPQIGNSRLSI